MHHYSESEEAAASSDSMLAMPMCHVQRHTIIKEHYRHRQFINFVGQKMSLDSPATNSSLSICCGTGEGLEIGQIKCTEYFVFNLLNFFLLCRVVKVPVRKCA